jgi:hypothetical protein
MKRLTTSCLMLATLASVTACTTNSKQAEVRPLPNSAAMGGPAAARGRELFARGDYALALEAFRREAREHPDSAEGYNGIAAAYDMIGRYDLSERYYQMALAHAPMDGRIYRNMARSLAMQGRQGEGQALLAEWDAINAGKMVVATVPMMNGGKALSETASASAPSSAAPSSSGTATTVPESAAVAEPQAVAPLVASAVAVEPTKPAVVAVADPAPVAVPVAAAAPTPVVVAAAQPVLPALSPPAATRITSIKVPRAPVLAQRTTPASLAPVRASGSMMPVRLVNAAGEAGLARRMQQHLAQAGVARAQLGNASRRYRLSWLVYPVGHRAQALNVQKSLPFATRLVAKYRAKRIVVVLGANARMAGGAAAKSRRG